MSAKSRRAACRVNFQFIYRAFLYMLFHLTAWTSYVPFVLFLPVHPREAFRGSSINVSIKSDGKLVSTFNSDSLISIRFDLTDTLGDSDNESDPDVINAVKHPVEPVAGDEDIVMPEPTISDIVAESGGEFDTNGNDFDLLFNALEAADLVDTLADPEANLTVFAPTDEAFVRLAQDLGFEGTDEAGAFDAIVSALTDLGNGDPIPVLTDVLLYHVSPEGKRLSEIQELDTVETLLDGATFTPEGNELVDNDPDLLNPEFLLTLSDIRAQNGSMIQGIDRVLIPLDLPNSEPDISELPAPVEPTIADIVSASGGTFDTDKKDFDLLLNALQAADLVDVLADPEADLTVFAPTDAAFIRLAQDLGYEGKDEAGAFGAIVSTLTNLGEGDPIPLLTDVLLYHVSPDGKRLRDIKQLSAVDTLLEGSTITPNGNRLIDNDPDLLDPKFQRGLTNIRAQSGSMIQGINRVLIPVDLDNEAIALAAESMV